MIPAEVEFPGVLRILSHEREELNNAMLLDNLDLINEHRDRALVRIQNYQHAAAKYYNSNVRNRRFNEGVLVLRKVFQNTAERNAGKLGANWEGPYKIRKVVQPGSYEIANMQGVKIPRTWNSMHLKNIITKQIASQPLNYETTRSPKGIRWHFVERQIQLFLFLKKGGAGTGTYTYSYTPKIKISDITLDIFKTFPTQQYHRTARSSLIHKLYSSPKRTCKFTFGITRRRKNA
ncbi:hypothetical protein YC2023_040492 [Brassica napus]